VTAHPLRIGLKIIQQTHPIDVLRDAWIIADEGGFDHIWAFDHMLSVHSDPRQPVLDGWTLLASMAEVTHRARIGLNVTGNLYRHPGLLAKIATTVDHLSGGRLEFGIGAAWNEPEFAMMGLACPPAAVRIRMLDEACQVLKALWTQERATFSGRHYTLSEAIAEPKPLQKPHPPIWIGGSGPRFTLRAAARHADVWNALRSTDPTISSAILDEHCAKIGRDPRTIRRSVAVTFTAVETALTEIEAYVRAGFTEILVTLAGTDPRGEADRAARLLLPRARSLA
jgi:F420-dependent oxidoreductase-like protein